ncbi:zinc-dependent alcohol dehydrogenase family protein [Mucilaginibacter sp.]|uniref:zinc-dependent alcohol dehydrogenase family protein n=1 Tax=Mucilaginibacter sp. TaxID=1882438 RepID=UPI0032642AF3
MTIRVMMNAMVLEHPGRLLVYKKMAVPIPSDRQVLIKVSACGICRTDLHIIDGELKKPKLPLVPGHEIIGRVVSIGKNVTTLKINDLVGVPWLGYTCGYCKFCKRGEENLCDNAEFTGYTIDGGFSEYTVADALFCLPLTARFARPESAPLLCAGLIGYRCYSMISTGAKNIGIYGFGSAAHIITQIAKAQEKQIFAFTREGNIDSQLFALKMGADWAGSVSELPPEKLDAAIIFAPAGELIPQALAALDKRGEVVCGGIHMSDVPAFSYQLLWGERSVKSVANITRQDGKDFFDILNRVPVHTQTQVFHLQQANEAISKLRHSSIQGAAVLVM